MADTLLEKFLAEEGKYLENIGMVLRSLDVFRTEGEQMSQILYLIGVRPVWKNGLVSGLEVIPLSELHRPRIDVTIRTSGIFRDTLPNLIHLLDRAFDLVAGLDEVEKNFVLKHTLQATVLPRT